LLHRIYVTAQVSYLTDGLTYPMATFQINTSKFCW